MTEAELAAWEAADESAGYGEFQHTHDYGVREDY